MVNSSKSDPTGLFNYVLDDWVFPLVFVQRDAILDDT